jgi:hypothetical protein
VSRRPAHITQADIARAIRAAKQEGASVVEVKVGENATITIRLDGTTDAQKDEENRDETRKHVALI